MEHTGRTAAMRGRSGRRTRRGVRGSSPRSGNRTCACDLASARLIPGQASSELPVHAAQSCLGYADRIALRPCMPWRSPI